MELLGFEPKFHLWNVIPWWWGRLPTPVFWGFPGDSVTGKEFACNEGGLGSIPGLRRSPGGGHGNPLQYSSLENPHRQGSLVCCSPWGHRVRHDWVTKHSTALGLFKGTWDPWERLLAWGAFLEFLTLFPKCNVASLGDKTCSVEPL